MLFSGAGGTMYPMCKYLEASLLCRPRKSLNRLFTEKSFCLKSDMEVWDTKTERRWGDHGEEEDSQALRTFTTSQFWNTQEVLHEWMVLSPSWSPCRPCKRSCRHLKNKTRSLETQFIKSDMEEGMENFQLRSLGVHQNLTGLTKLLFLSQLL